MQRYTISRNGQTYGPYSMDELQRYLASGHVLPTDLARADEVSEWLPVSQILASATPADGTPQSIPPAYTPPNYGTVPAVGYMPPMPGQLSPTIEAPPNLNWILYLLLGVLTCGLFIVIFELVQAAWLRRIYPSSRVLFLYIVALVFYLLQLSSSVATTSARMHGANPPGAFGITGGLASLAYLIVVLVARFTMRSDLEQHYNTVEPIGLSLSGIMTFFFGSFYFQYHFNRINEMKRAMLYGGIAPR